MRPASSSVVLEGTARLDQAVGEPHTQRFLAGHAGPVKNQVERVALADQARQAIVPPSIQRHAQRRQKTPNTASLARRADRTTARARARGDRPPSTPR